MAQTEKQMYDFLKLWQPYRQVSPASQFVDKDNLLYDLFSHLYSYTKKICVGTKRKNGECWFIHPMNTVLNLKRARVTDVLTYCIGLLHDIIEDQTDFYQKKYHFGKDKKSLEKLNEFEEEAFQKLEEEISSFLPKAKTKLIINGVDLLTRRKGEYYLYSVSKVFNCSDKDIKERVIQVKLADRIHNILCIENFDEEKRLYECFKNLFVLNNTKKFIMEKHGRRVSHFGSLGPTEKLFTKCCKATYDALLVIRRETADKGIGEVQTLLQLAFQKFAFEMDGIRRVTSLDEEEKHPMRLYHNVIRKLEARLHRDWDLYNRIKAEETAYCKKFFAVFKFDDKLIKALIDYKDAYALKEILGKVLYLPDYFIKGFLTNQLKLKGRL